MNYHLILKSQGPILQKSQHNWQVDHVRLKQPLGLGARLPQQYFELWRSNAKGEQYNLQIRKQCSNLMWCCIQTWPNMSLVQNVQKQFVQSWQCPPKIPWKLKKRKLVMFTYIRIRIGFRFIFLKPFLVYFSSSDLILFFLVFSLDWLTQDSNKMTA